MTRALAFVLAMLTLSPELASAQHLGEALARPSASRRARRTRRSRAERIGLGDALGVPSVRAPLPSTVREEAPPQPFLGPQIQLFYSFYRMADGYGGGDVNAGGLALYVKTPVPELRLGVMAELGVHAYSLGEDGLVARGAIDVGFQLVRLIEPLVPHVSFLISFGALTGTRFDTTVAYAFGGAGLALGAELHIVRNLHLGIEGSYLRQEMDGASFDVFMFRLMLGM